MTRSPDHSITNSSHLLLQTLALQAAIRAALYLVPFKTLSNHLATRAARHPRRTAIPVARLIWAVRATARYIPRATCLTQALTAKYQLERAGHHAQIHIGIAKDANTLTAHAWLESNGETLLGGEIAQNYAHLTTLKSPDHQ